MNLVVSFGGQHLARIERVAEITWEDYVDILSTAVETPDKASRGWSCPARFVPAYRDSEHLEHRYALTFDYDHVTADDVEHIFETFKDTRFFAYTTWSHTPEKPRWRIVMPLDRPATYDEFQAVSRKVADRAGIELAARESHVPAQMMFLPTVRPGQTARCRHNTAGSLVYVDDVLAEYEDWTDRRSWPHRKDADGVHDRTLAVDPTTKPGLVGAFCRAYSVPEAITHFRLPYVPTSTPDRWTYTGGSRPEGAIIYDEGKKLHSHHDTDPARGQNNAFDLVRLHLYGMYDSAEDLDRPVTERPSFKCMVDQVANDPAVQAQIGASEFADLGPPADTAPMPEAPAASWTPLAKPLDVVLSTPTQTRWLIRNEIERGVIALMAGPRGSYKSFHAIHWAMRVAVEGLPVYVVSAEGGDFQRRAEAWLSHHGYLGQSLPLYVLEKRLDLSTREGVEVIRQDCLGYNIRPALFILDTFSKLSGGLDENDNSAVKAFIGRLDNGLKRPEAFDATVLLVAHTGHSDATRARGASALEADTDAAYIVQRDATQGLVNISRERFKSSPELPPLIYRPTIVTLDRVDADLVPVTSVVLEPADSVERQRTRGPTGGNQRLLWRTLKELTPDGGTLDVGELLTVAARKLPHDRTQRDLRRQRMRSALDSLAREGHIYLHDEYVSTTPIVLDKGDWLE